MTSRAAEPNSERSSAPVTIDEVLGIMPGWPSLTTRDRGWSGVTVDLYDRIPECSLRYPAFDHHVICFSRTGEKSRMVQGRDGVIHEALSAPGRSLLMPAGYDSLWEGIIAPSARLRIPPSLIAAAAEELGGRSTSQFEVRNVFEMRDPLIERVALTLISELEQKAHPAQALIVDSISCALAAHMLRSYNAFEPVPEAVARQLGTIEMARLTMYIEDNIDRLIGLGELAALVNVSRFHFTRLFKRSTGTTAIRFVEECRIRRAQALIEQGGTTLAEIALMAGFADQSHFTRRFHQHVGCTPAAYSRERGIRRTAR